MYRISSKSLVLTAVLVMLIAYHPEAVAMGKWLERKLTGDVGGQFWKNVEKAKPIMKQNADSVLRQLGYEPGVFASHVFFAGEGEEVWTVAYWRTHPENIVITPRDVEVYLNIRGEVKRVSKFDHGHEQFIYGKDERIDIGMTFDQVLNRLGKPDYKGPLPHSERRLGDELWKYNTNATRTKTAEIYFEAGRVSSVSYFGENRRRSTNPWTHD